MLTFTAGETTSGLVLLPAWPLKQIDYWSMVTLQLHLSGQIGMQLTLEQPAEVCVLLDCRRCLLTSDCQQQALRTW